MEIWLEYLIQDISILVYNTGSPAYNAYYIHRGSLTLILHALSYCMLYPLSLRLRAHYVGHTYHT